MVFIWTKTDRLALEIVLQSRAILSVTALGLFSRHRVWKLTPKCQDGVSLQG